MKNFLEYHWSIQVKKTENGKYYWKANLKGSPRFIFMCDSEWRQKSKCIANIFKTMELNQIKDFSIWEYQIGRTMIYNNFNKKI